jgi:DNA-binding MarR family transcriptional regulator
VADSWAHVAVEAPTVHGGSRRQIPPAPGAVPSTPMAPAVGKPGGDYDRSVTGAPSTSLPPAIRPYFGPVLRRAHLWAGACAEAAFPTEFHVSGLPVLLSVAAGPSSQRELADRLSLNRTVMVQIVDRLEAGGLVARRRDSRDRRSYAIALTDEGRRKLAAFDADADEAERCTNRNLAEPERERLNTLLRRLVRAYGAPEYPAPMAGRNGFLLVRADFCLRDVGREALGALGLDQRLFTALVVLDDIGPCPQQRLAGELDVSGTIVVQLADRLEAAGHLARRRSPTDRRVFLLTVTPEGAEALAKARTVMDDARGEVAAALGPGEADELHRLCLRLLGEG